MNDTSQTPSALPDPEEVASTIRAGGGLAAIVGRLHGLRPFPEVAQRLLDLVCDDRHETARVVSVIESDLELTAKVLRLINSGAFGLRHKCESVERSIVLLGSRQVAEVALAQLAMDQMDDSGHMGRVVRRHSVAVASLSRRLSRECPELTGIDTFTAGILHDLGKLLQLQVDQGEYATLTKTAPRLADRFHEMERANFGYDHAGLAAYVMSGWRLPPFLINVVRCHHAPERARIYGKEVVAAVAVLRVADALDYIIEEHPEPAPDISDEVANMPDAVRLGLGAERLNGMWRELAELKARIR